jgi:hypothetical protein
MHDNGTMEHCQNTSKLYLVAQAMVATIAVFLFLEIILRVGLFFWFGYSKYYLFYGFAGLAGRVAVRPSWTGAGKHYKFPPNYTVQGHVAKALKPPQ